MENIAEWLAAFIEVLLDIIDEARKRKKIGRRMRM